MPKQFYLIVVHGQPCANRTKPGPTVSNSRCGHACVCHAVILITKTAYLNVENAAQTNFRLSLVSISAQNKLYMTFIEGYA